MRKFKVNFRNIINMIIKISNFETNTNADLKKFGPKNYPLHPYTNYE